MGGQQVPAPLPMRIQCQKGRYTVLRKVQSQLVASVGDANSVTHMDSLTPEPVSSPAPDGRKKIGPITILIVIIVVAALAYGAIVMLTTPSSTPATGTGTQDTVKGKKKSLNDANAQASAEDSSGKTKKKGASGAASS